MIGNRNRQVKRTGLCLALSPNEASKLKNVLEVNLGSPFGVDDTFAPTPSPMSLNFTFPSSEASTPLIFTSSFYDNACDAYVDSDPEEEAEAEEDDAEAQYITIPVTSEFYNPPPSARSSFSPWVQGSEDEEPIPSMSFSCDALVPEARVETKSPAELFHQMLEQVLPQLSGSVVLDEFLHGVDMELYESPVQAFQDVCLDSLNPADRASFSLHPLQRLCLRDVPDVPVDLDDVAEESVTEVKVETVVPLIVTPPTPQRRPAGLAPLLDRRLVAPFETEESPFSTTSTELHIRASFVPSHPLCGLRVFNVAH
ncbi:hypothetical protein BDZ89DRAFT_1079252 [Hymenopellis radicata]|nr:hypothetical protein BDZ89DRAFT_1079252 [Hymenopellis radicata]